MAAMLMVAGSAFAQQQLFQNNNVKSPEVNPDGSVTFRLVAPKAMNIRPSRFRASCIPTVSMWMVSGCSIRPTSI